MTRQERQRMRRLEDAVRELGGCVLYALVYMNPRGSGRMITRMADGSQGKAYWMDRFCGVMANAGLNIDREMVERVRKHAPQPARQRQREVTDE